MLEAARLRRSANALKPPVTHLLSLKEPLSNMTDRSDELWVLDDVDVVSSPLLLRNIFWQREVRERPKYRPRVHAVIDAVEIRLARHLGRLR